MPRYTNEKLQEAIADQFTYHAPQGDQLERYQLLRDKGKELALLIVELTPPSADQAAAIRLVRESVMTANAAIALENSSGKPLPPR